MKPFQRIGKRDKPVWLEEQEEEPCSSDKTFQSSDITFSKFGSNVFKVRIYRLQC